MHAAQLEQFIREEHAKGNAIPEEFFDSSSITPATQFMYAAGVETEKYIQLKLQQEAWRTVKFVFSGSNTPGEGEHKIMTYLRSVQHLSADRFCIYSPDADMILLGLVTHFPHVIILRETGHHNDDVAPRGFECEQPSFDLIFLSVLREYFQLEFPSLDVERVVDDFVLLVTFVGNDFVPTIPTFDINEGALNYLMDQYRTSAQHLNTAGKVNWPVLSQFLQSFVEHEKSVLERPIKQQGKGKTGALTRLLDLAEQQPGQDLPLEQIKSRYYRDCFKLPIDQQAERIQTCVREYLEGIQWVMDYYYQGCGDWGWFFPHHYAPMLSDFKDLSGIMRLDAEGNVQFAGTPPYEHMEQLLMVIPPSAAALLPAEYREVVNIAGTELLFPRTVETEHDVLAVRATWSSIKVLLPFADRTAVRRVLAGITPGAETQKLLTTLPEKEYRWGSAAIEAKELPETSGPRFAVAALPSPGERAGDWPSLKWVEGACRLTAEAGSDYMTNFQLPSMRYSVAQAAETASFDEFVGKVVFTGFPFQLPSLVEFVSYRNRVTPREQASKLSSDYPSFASRLRKDLSVSLRQVQGLEVAGGINAVLHVKHIAGYKKSLLGRKEYEWSGKLKEVPAELGVRVPEGWKDPTLAYAEDLASEFPLGSTVVVLDESHFGCMAKVTALKPDDFYPKGKLEVRVCASPLSSLPPLFQDITSKHSPNYSRLEGIAKRLNQPPALISRFTQSLIVSDLSGNDRVKRFELGLNLRKDKERLCVPGAARWAYLWDQQTTEWEYSDTVVDALEEYARRFPLLWDGVNRLSPGLKMLYAREVFAYMGSGYWEELRKAALWVMQLPTYKRKWASIKSQEAPKALVDQYLEAVDSALSIAAPSGQVLVLNPGLVHSPSHPAIPRFLLNPMRFSLGDRVRVLHDDSWSVPIGAEGTLIGTYNDTHASVLLDLPIRNSASKHPAIVVPNKYLVNLSRPIAGINRGPMDYACVDFQVGDKFIPVFARPATAPEAQEVPSRVVISLGAPSNDYQVIKGEDGLPVSVRVDYPHDLDKYQFEFEMPLRTGERTTEVQLPEGFQCKLLFDFVNK